MTRRGSGQRSRRVLSAWAIAMAIGIVLIARTPFSADLSAFLPANPDARQRVLLEQLQNGVAARTLFIGIEGGNAASRAEASRALAAALRASAQFEQVQNGDGADWKAAGEWIFRHRYQLSPAIADARFSVAGLRDAIDETLSLLGTPAGNALKPILDRDPTGETARIAEALIPATAPRTEHGVWVSRKAPRAILLTITRAPGSDLDALQRTLDGITREFRPHAAGGLQLRLSGAPLFSVQSRARIEHEVKLLATVGTLVIGGLLLLVFGSLRALAVAMLPVATGVVCGIAAVGIGFGNVHGITLAFGSTLIGEAVDYAVYYLIQARAGQAAGLGWIQWRQVNWPTVRLGLLTSVCGFAALLFSGFPGLAQLGLFSICGLAGAAITTRFVLPALMPDGAVGQGLRRPLAALAGWGLKGLPRLRVPLLVLGIAATILLTVQWQQLWRGSLGSLSPVSRAALALDAELRADLGASDAGMLVVASGPDLETTLLAAETAATRLDALVDAGRLAGYDTPTRLLPSLATQRARMASIPSAATLRDRLREATRDGPLEAIRLDPFVADLMAAGAMPPIDRAQLAGSPLAPAVDALLFQRRGGGWSALLPLQLAGQDPGAATVEAALRGAGRDGQIQVVAIGQELDSLYRRYLREALTQSLLGALAVVAVLGIHLRSSRRVFAICLPLAGAVLLTLAGLALFQVELGILHLVGLLLVVAVGSNYGLFFDQRRVDDGADADLQASLLLANFTTVISFGLIAMSDIPALSAIGRVVAPGAFLALVLAAVLQGPPPRAAMGESGNPSKA